MINRLTRGLALAASVALCLSVSPTAQAAAETASANGQGTLDSGARHFSFSAKQNADGTVSGHATLTNKSFTGTNGTSPYKLQIEIVCMNDVGNNTVYFGGNVKSTNEGDPVYHDSVFFAVQDNGEPGKGVDKISRAYFWDYDPAVTGDPMACENNVAGDFPLETIEAGNVQVK